MVARARFVNQLAPASHAIPAAGARAQEFFIEFLSDNMGNRTTRRPYHRRRASPWNCPSGAPMIIWLHYKRFPGKTSTISDECGHVRYR
jgi:hypothetical protein